MNLRTVPEPKRVGRRGGPLACLFDWLVPAVAVCWGELTHEDEGWLAEAGRWQARAVRATVVRPCPAFDRLAETMGEPGKVSSDALVPAHFNRWGQG